MNDTTGQLILFGCVWLIMTLLRCWGIAQEYPGVGWQFLRHIEYLYTLAFSAVVGGILIVLIVNKQVIGAILLTAMYIVEILRKWGGANKSIGIRDDSPYVVLILYKHPDDISPNHHTKFAVVSAGREFHDRLRTMQEENLPLEVSWLRIRNPLYGKPIKALRSDDHTEDRILVIQAPYAK